ncbi:peptidylprolyl isomerase [Nanoarchaeota archaeon]|nr:MAG: peptidylprolyl isomerase [Nanoarchaeota archaeon]
MKTVEQGAFVELEYVGRVASTNFIFDATSKLDPDVEKVSGPVKVVVGENFLIKGLEEALIGKREGDVFEIEISPEKGFGKKKAELIKMVPLKDFLKYGVNPEPGMQVDFDGLIATVRTVTSGRVIVDFNHPLSGQTLKYKVKVKRIIEDPKEKVNILIKLYTGKDLDVVLHDGKVEIPAEVFDIVKDKVKKYTGLEPVKEVKEDGVPKK